MTRRNRPLLRAATAAGMLLGVTALGCVPPAAAAATVPDAPQSVWAHNGVNQATVFWTEPATDGGSPITGYTATSSPGGKTCTGSPSATSCAVIGLTNGLAYTFTITATNAVGDSVPSDPTNAVTPTTDTHPPVIVSSTIDKDWMSTAASGVITIEVHITDDVSGVSKPLIGYDLPHDIKAWQSTLISGNAFDGWYRAVTHFLPGSTPGTWEAAVTSLRDIAGNYVSPITPHLGHEVLVGFPDRPANVVSTPGADRSVTVAWDVPDDGGSVLTGYLVTELESGSSFATTDTSVTIPYPDRPANAPLTYVVNGRNAVGYGWPSAASDPVLVATRAPGAPGSPSVYFNGHDLTGNWSEPAHDGGSPVLSYTLTADPGGATCTTSSHSCTIAALTSGTSYTASVTATNAAGTSPASDASGPAIADDIAPAISSFTWRLASGSALSGTSVPITLSWSAADTGGSGLNSMLLGESTDGHSFSNYGYSPSTRSVMFRAPSSGSRTYRLSAYDGAQNQSPFAFTPTLLPRLVQPSSSVMSLSTGWATSTSSAYSGGSTRYATAAGRSVSYKATGRAVGLVTTTGRARGKAKVYVNGVYQQTIDLYASSNHYRVIAWQHTWTTSATRTIKVVVLGTRGRPRVDLDAFVVIR